MRKLGTIGLVSLLVIGTFGGVLNFGSENAQAPYVCLAESGTWTQINSPYIVIFCLGSMAGVYVPTGSSLTIEPGVDVKFDTSVMQLSLVVRDGASLTAVGTETDRITFTSNSSSPSMGDWFMIMINETADVEIKHADISYAMYGNFHYLSSYNQVADSSFSYNWLVGVFLGTASFNTIANNTFSDSPNGAGVGIIDGSNNNTITYNHFSNSMNGIWLMNLSSYNTITHNNITDNLFMGIGVGTSTYNLVTDNNISNHMIGLNFSAANYNRIYHNNFIDNTVQAVDNGTNFWNDTYPSGGNYWSDYDTPAEGCMDNFDGATTPQTGGGGPDGICDSPYIIDADSRDYYPLTTRWEPVTPPDTTPPVITNLQPPDSSTTSDSTPTISADYSDPSGIDTSSVLLEVDSIDVTSSAMVTPSGVTYTPPAPLSDGLHDVYLEVQDTKGNPGTATWSFTVDTTQPAISNQQPPDASTTSDNTPDIGADYSDPSGIDVSSVILEFNGTDVTADSTKTASGVTYTPSVALQDGLYNVYLKVNDTLGNQATSTWSFTIDTTIDTTPPTTDAGPDQDADQGDTVVFDGSGSSDDSGTVANYTWVFTYDGATTKLYEEAPSFKFEKVGNYEVTLTAKDPSGNPASDTMWVNVTGVDTDGDGLTDYDEENIYLTDPNDPDTDGDGMNDGDEVDAGRDPLNAEAEDADFLSQYWWLFVLIIIIIIILLILILLLRRRKKPEDEEAPPTAPMQEEEIPPP